MLTKVKMMKTKLNFNSGLCTVQPHPMFPNDTYAEPTPLLYTAVISLSSLLWTSSHFQRNNTNPRNYSISLLSSNSSYCFLAHSTSKYVFLPTSPPCFALFCRLCVQLKNFSDCFQTCRHQFIAATQSGAHCFVFPNSRRTVRRNRKTWIL